MNEDAQLWVREDNVDIPLAADGSAVLLVELVRDRHLRRLDLLLMNASTIEHARILYDPERQDPDTLSNLVVSKDGVEGSYPTELPFVISQRVSAFASTPNYRPFLPFLEAFTRYGIAFSRMSGEPN